MIRIIGGEKRGTLIHTLEGKSTRPLRNQVREALFNILQAEVPGSRALDLFAGSGAVGLEALSRGAESCLFVDSSHRAVALIRQNIGKLGYSGRATVEQRKLPAGLFTLPPPEAAFDLAFVTPPYAKGLAQRTLEALGASDLLSEGALVITEVERRESLEPGCGWHRVDDRTYGITRLLILRRAAPPPTG